jgi:hypothetical protein
MPVVLAKGQTTSLPDTYTFQDYKRLQRNRFYFLSILRAKEAWPSVNAYHTEFARAKNFSLSPFQLGQAGLRPQSEGRWAQSDFA